MRPFNFDFGDRFVEVGPWALAFRVYSEFNVYTPAPEAMSVAKEGDRIVVTAERYAWAGLQKGADGKFRAEIQQKGDEIEWTIRASLHERIKGTATYVRGVAGGEVAVGNFYFRPLGPGENDLLQYPKMAQLRFPMYFIRHSESDYTFALSEDTEVRAKSFAAQFEGESVLLELHHHEDARRWGTEHETPRWRLGRTENPPEILSRRMRRMEDTWGLEPWETRADVPDWARRVCLVLNLHGAHWTGFVYNDYARQLEIIRHVCERIDGSHVLGYLPAWDGRYNYNWPRYEPDPDMGGEEGLERLVAGAHELGVHLIPQIGAQSANRRWLPPGLHSVAFQDAFGNPYSKAIDWDGDHMPDTYRVDATLGHPGFRRFIFDKICGLKERFGFDGIFLDINQVFFNDPRFHITEGHLDLAARLHERFEDFLVFGESWYDGLMPAYALVHCSRGIFERWNEIFERYCRVTYHLRHPAPGRGSTGVFEAGFSEPFVPDPEIDAIPAVAFVEDTLDRHEDHVDAVIEVAGRYGRRKGIL